MVDDGDVIYIQDFMLLRRDVLPISQGYPVTPGWP